MDLNLLKHFLKSDCKDRWTLLGADGRVLDVLENAANHIGQSIFLVAPTVSGSSNTTSILDARSRNPRNPENVTINLSVDEAPWPAGAFVIPQAKITWGSGGALNSAIVDVVKGTQISVAASLIRIDGIYNAPTVAGTLPQIRMNANLAYGNRPGSGVAPGFTAIDLLNGAGTTNLFTIPAFARDVTVYTTTNATFTPGDIRILFASDDNPATTSFVGSVDQNEATAPNTVRPIAYPIPGFARQVVIKNLGANVVQTIVRFGLSL